MTDTNYDHNAYVAALMTAYENEEYEVVWENPEVKIIKFNFNPFFALASEVGASNFYVLNRAYGTLETGFSESASLDACIKYYETKERRDESKSSNEPEITLN